MKTQIRNLPTTELLVI